MPKGRPYFQKKGLKSGQKKDKRGKGDKKDKMKGNRPMKVAV